MLTPGNSNNLNPWQFESQNMVIKSEENSLEEFTTNDGEHILVEPKWR